MKPLRRLLTIIIFLLSSIIFIGTLLFIPIQYIFTGKTTLMEIITKILDELINRVNPDKLCQ